MNALRSFAPPTGNFRPHGRVEEMRDSIAESVTPRFGHVSRALDLFIAVAVLVFTLPLLVFITAAVWGTDRGPPIFVQSRIGRGGKTFRCLKFRSMAVDADVQLRRLLESDLAAQREWKETQKLKHDPRITAIGGFLRKSSLDELPQVFNVIRGEMSIVGPRPIIDAEIVRYGKSFPHYCRVRPGITGLWQVSGRSEVSYRRRVALDRLYARSKCLSVDANILIRTIPAVLFARGSH